jgi:1-deoxy-D-xylulose-5-phosphate reductoisomerase
VLNAANEAAVAAFLARRVGFLDIARVVEDVLAGWEEVSAPVESLQHVQAVDYEARQRAEEGCRKRSLSD